MHSSLHPDLYLVGGRDPDPGDEDAREGLRVHYCILMARDWAAALPLFLIAVVSPQGVVVRDGVDIASDGVKVDDRVSGHQVIDGRTRCMPLCIWIWGCGVRHHHHGLERWHHSCRVPIACLLTA